MKTQTLSLSLAPEEIKMFLQAGLARQRTTLGERSHTGSLPKQQYLPKSCVIFNILP